ncbi:MAG: hypothetical protein GF409_00670 [Candidatus Omnitrophica bacterium]|nr:hypothetical protein [Candidatus Omnitrophota bacterium]
MHIFSDIGAGCVDRSMNPFVRKGPMRGVISLLVAGLFLINFLTCDIAGALSGPVDLSRTGSVGPGAPRLLKPLEVDSFRIPEALGVVDSMSEGSSGRMVIHIQDAHCNYQVQRTIASLISHLRDNYGVRTVNLEGGWGEYDLSPFTSIENGKTRRNVSDYFLKGGVLNGAEFYAINNDGLVDLWGVEDKDLYLDNLKVYRDSSGYRQKGLSIIRRLSRAAEALKDKIYSAKIRRLDEAFTRYTLKEEGILKYLALLRDEAGKLGISLDNYPNLQELTRTSRIEESIDLARANRERDLLVDRFEKVLSVNEIARLSGKIRSFKAGVLSREDFYAYLRDKAHQVGLDAEEYPELFKYDSYVRSFALVDKVSAKRELLALDRKVREGLYTSAEEKKLDEACRALSVLQELFTFRLKDHFYRLYLEQGGFDLNGSLSFIEEKAELYRIEAGLEEGIRELDGYTNRISLFYERSRDRDLSFLRNMRFGDGPREAAILVTGGFHTDRLLELLKKRGYSCVSIIPAYRSSPKGSGLYHHLLSGGTDPLSEALSPFVSNMQVASILTELATDAWDPTHYKAILAAKDGVQLMMDTGNPLRVYSPDEKHSIRLYISDGQIQFERDPEDFLEEEEKVNIMQLIEMYGVRRPKKRPADVPRQAPGEESRIDVPDGINRLIQLMSSFTIADESSIDSTVVVPDLHGNMQKLDDALSRVTDPDQEIVFLGDYMDRGREGIKVMRRVMELSRTRRVIPLMGNHDLMLIMAMMGDEWAFQKWLENGGLKVLAELGYRGVEQIESFVKQAMPGIQMALYAGEHAQEYELLRQAVMQDKVLKEITQWMQENLYLYYIGSNGVLYVHAGLPMDEGANITLRYTADDGTSYEKLPALAKLEEEMKRSFSNSDPSHRASQFLLRGITEEDIARNRPYEEIHPQRRSPLWVRYADRLGKSSVELASMVMRGREASIMEQLGVSMMVVGHTPVTDPMTELINLNNRIFYIDRDYREDSGVVLYNGVDGIEYTLGSPVAHQLVEKEVFLRIHQAARERARQVLKDIRDKYVTSSGTDLLGKLFDENGEMVTEVSVRRAPDRPSVLISNAADGTTLYNKYGEPVKSLPFREKYEYRSDILKDKPLQQLKELRDTYKGREKETAGLSYKVLSGAIEVLERAELSVLINNDYGILGVSDDSGKVPYIYLCDMLIKDPEMFTIALFHEAAEIYLARNRHLVPEGLDTHRLLRGASSSDRRQNPEDYTRGVQDELFGQLNNEFTYRITHAQGDFIYDDEIRLIAAFLSVHGNDLQDAQNALLKPHSVPRMTKSLARAFLNMRKSYLDARERHAETKDFASTLAHDNMYQALGVLRKLLREHPHHMARYLKSSCEGGYTALHGIQEIRVQILLEKFVEGKIDQVRVLPTPRNKALSDLMDTVAANLSYKGRRGAIVEIPAGKEVIIVGDLHTRLSNLRKILYSNNNLQKIKSGEAVLLILGDALHPAVDCMMLNEDDDLMEKLAEMTSSFEILQFIHRLKREYPDNVHYLLGNHDYLSSRIGKAVSKTEYVPQGVVFRQEMLKWYGPEYVEVYKQFLASSPLMVRTPDGLVALHAGPVKSAHSIRDIRKADPADADDAIVNEATWSRWENDYGEGEVHGFLKMVGGKILVVGHTSDLIARNSFFHELMPDTHYVTMGGLDVVGYLSFRDGKITPFNLTSKLAEEETELTGDVIKLIEEGKTDAVEHVSEPLKERVAKLESRFGELQIRDVLGSGTFGKVLEVEDEDGNRFALKLAGGIVGEERNELYRARMALKINDVPFGIAMQERSNMDEVDWVPRIIDVGIEGREPYVATEIIRDYRKIDLSLLVELERKQIHSLMQQIARIVTSLESMGAIMYDPKLENFGYKEGRVILLDTGACNVNRNLLEGEHLARIEQMGIRTTEENWTGDDVLEDIIANMVEKLDALLGNEITKEEIESVTRKERSRARIATLYAKSGELIKNIRERDKPVVVFMQHLVAEGATAQFTLIRRLERDLKKKYDTENLRVMLYDGTRQGLDSAMGRAETILKIPGAKAVAYVSPQMHPGEVSGNVLYVKEECPWGGDMLSMVGPHVMLAMGLVNFQEGTASVELVRDIEHLLKLMIGDRETLKSMNSEGVEVFLKNLIRGISILKMKKIDLKKMRDVVEAQEKLLHSL